MPYAIKPLELVLIASDTGNLRGIPIANSLGVTSDSDRIELFRSLDCQRTVVD